MKTFRRTIFVIAFLMTIASVTLLVTNYTPFNPTHRRYSSEHVVTTGDDQKLKGDSAEKVLSEDLGIIINDSEEGGGYCLCHKENTDTSTSASGSRCKVCLVDLPLSDNAKHRIPDFVTDDYIADSKNHFSITKLEHQMNDFIAGAIKLEIPLWIYVRTNSKINPEVEKAITDTHGGVVYYLRPKNYIDPTDTTLERSIIGGSIVMGILSLWEIVVGFFAFSLPTIRQPKSSVVVPEHKTSRKARHTTDDSEDFMRNIGNNTRNTLDE